MIYKCGECFTMISESEYMVHWGSCSECFDKRYTEYLSQVEEDLEVADYGEDS